MISSSARSQLPDRDVVDVEVPPEAVGIEAVVLRRVLRDFWGLVPAAKQLAET